MFYVIHIQWEKFIVSHRHFHSYSIFLLFSIIYVCSTVQVGVSHHVHGRVNIEFLAEPLNSRWESGENTPILQFSGFWVLVSNLGVVFHLSAHSKQVKLGLNCPFIVSGLLREVSRVSIRLDNTISRKWLNTCQATFPNKKYMLHWRVGLLSDIIASLAAKDDLESY